MRGYGRDSSVLLWGWALWGLGQGLWSYLWPLYVAGLGASSVEVGIVVSANFVTATLCYVPGGFVSQLGRHKWQVVAGHVLPVLGVTSYALARTWWQVLPGVVALAAVALVAPTVNSLIVQIADEEDVPASRLFLTLGAILYAGMVITPPLGGLIADRWGMRAVFPLAGGCYAGFVCLMTLLRSRAAPTDPDHAPGAARRSALHAGGGAYAGLLRDPRIRILLLTAFLLHGGMHLGLSFAPLYLGEVYGWDRALVGWMGSAASAGTVLLLLSMERFRRRFGAVAATWLASGCMVAHFACTVLSGAVPVQALGFLGRGGFQSMATMTTVAMTEAVPRGRVAPAIALLATVAAGAAIVAPPSGGWLFARAPAAPFAAGIAVLALSAPLVAASLRGRVERAPRGVGRSRGRGRGAGQAGDRLVARAD